MESLKQKIKDLQKVSEELEPNETKRNELFVDTQVYANSFIEGLPQKKAFNRNKPSEGSLSIDGKAKNFTDLLELYDKEVRHIGLCPASGGHLAYIPGGGLYASAIADFLADISNEFAGLYFGSPGAVTMENEVLNWFKSIFGFPENAVGNLASGGSIANLIALTAARDKHKIKGVRIENSAIYLSEQTHHCIFKALRIIGLEDIVIRTLELDENHRVNVEYLKKLIQIDIQSGLHPFCIIANAGTTDTGAIDPIDEIGEIANEHNIWYHIDAAYGGFFVLTDSCKAKFKGIEKADSIVLDPHKGMFLPYGVGAVLVKDVEAVMQSHHYVANYMKDAYNSDLPISPADVSPELTKHFRGLRVWLPLQLHGIEPFKACLEEKLLLTKYFRERLISEGFQVGPEPDLSVSYFWWKIDDQVQQNEFNKNLMEEIHRDGTVFLSSTIINEKFVIRIAILAFRTKLSTIDNAMAMVLKAKEKVLSEIAS